ncbi:hypothetical protein B8W72_20850 [Pseudomonas putida]|uniref:Uncharacterized protein n=1 Tax=Pseudomonas putida TaxID=303 RepID=A0A1Y3KR20_PSEPU|nr:hypothetical protein [Pseudomonas putida]OUM28309.1 hypothetical protein B8W72_20850 [Pseudomonas putida]
MKYETSVVYVEQVPKVTVDTGFDLTTFLGFLVTMAVFALGTLLAMRNADKNSEVQRELLRLSLDSQAKSLKAQIDSQEKISKSNALKNSRQDWINSLRSEISHLLSVAHEIHTLAYDVRAQRITGETPEAIQNSWREHREKSDKFYSLVAKARFHVSNIQLHLNPAELDSQDLQKQIDLLVANAYENKPFVAQVDEIIRISQIILKKEWVRVKDMV